MFINLPHIFLNGIQKSRIQVNTGEYLILEASYEILQTHFNDNCKQYSQTYDQSFDKCKFEVMAKNLNTEINCSVPFIYKQNRTKDICQNEAVAKRAFWLIYIRDIFDTFEVPRKDLTTSKYLHTIIYIYIHIFLFIFHYRLSS